MTFRYDVSESCRTLQKLVDEKRLDTKTALALDVGCGRGVKTLVFKRFHRWVVGVDVDKSQLEVAREFGIEVVHCDATRLPFSDGAFDLVTSFHTLEHIRDDKAFISELARVMKPQAHLLMVTPNRTRISSAFVKIWKILTGVKLRYPMNPDHVFEYAASDLRRLFDHTPCLTYRIRPIGLIRLPHFQVALVPFFLRCASDQLEILAHKAV